MASLQRVNFTPLGIEDDDDVEQPCEQPSRPIRKTWDRMLTAIHENMAWLPTWARNEEAVKHAIRCGDFRNTHILDRVVGPAVKPAFLSASLLWAFYAIFPWISLRFTNCAEDERTFAQVSNTVVLLYLPVLVTSLFLEYVSMCRALPGIIVATGPLRLGGVQFSFGMWFALAFTLSILGHLDFATISLMVAKAIKTDECSKHGKSVVAADWAMVIEQSVYDGHAVEGFLRISTIATVGYFLIFAQLVFTLMNSIPIYKEYGPFHYQLQEPHKKPVWFDSCYLTKQGHGPAVFALAEASRMNTIKLTELQHTSIAKADWKARLTRLEMKRTATRVLVFNLMSSAIQPNIQCSIYALALSSSNGRHAQTLTVVANALSIFTACKGLVEEGVLVWTLYRMVQNAPISEDPETAKEDRWAKDCLSRWDLGRYTVFAVLSSLLQLYAVAKLIATTFICEDGPWNISGCVDLRRD